MDNHHFNQLQITWKNFGDSEPFWSVSTFENYKSHNINSEAIEKFYKSGEDTIHFFESILQKHNYSFKDKVVLDFGCGVGRMTKSCNDFAYKVYGMDISESHLKIARENDKKTEFFLVDNFESLPNLPSRPNVIFSVIALQHSRQELIAHHVNLLLNLLEKDGIALLHIPYFIENYDNVNNQINVMEMHFLPKFVIQMISNQNNCNVLEEVEIDFCGGNIKNCIYVIKK